MGKKSGVGGRGTPVQGLTPAARRRLDNSEKVYVGIDMHKKTLQVAAMDGNGERILETKLENKKHAIRALFSRFPNHAEYVIESSSVWYSRFRYMVDELGMDVVLSDPNYNKLVAMSKKKTDKNDAWTLADFLRCDYIVECYVPGTDVVEMRRMHRHRHKVVNIRTLFKNSINGIMLQDAIEIEGAKWTKGFIQRLQMIGDYRIDNYLGIIRTLDGVVGDLSAKMYARNAASEDAMRLKSIPGVGDVTAFTMVAELGRIDRFKSSSSVVAFAGLAPSVRNSADIVHHGHITKKGSRHLRWVAVEAVHAHIRYAPESNISEFYRRLAKKRGSQKATIAAAAKLIRVAYKEQRDYLPHHCQNPKPRDRT